MNFSDFELNLLSFNEYHYQLRHQEFFITQVFNAISTPTINHFAFHKTKNPLKTHEDCEL